MEFAKSRREVVGSAVLHPPYGWKRDLDRLLDLWVLVLSRIWSLGFRI